MRNKLFLFVFLFAVLAIVDSHAFERKKYNFNSEWRLQIGDFPEAKQSQFDDSRWKAVTLPHAFNEDEAFKVSIEQLTDTVVWYRKHFRIPASGKKQKVFVERFFPLGLACIWATLFCGYAHQSGGGRLFHEISDADQIDSRIFGIADQL